MTEKVDTTKPHVVTDEQGKRTHFLGEVNFSVGPVQPEPPTNMGEDHVGHEQLPRG